MHRCMLSLSAALSLIAALLAPLTGRAQQPAAQTDSVATQQGAVIDMRIGDRFATGPEAESLQKLAQSHPIVPLYWTSVMEQSLGLTPEEVVLVSLAFDDNGGDALVVTREPYDRHKIIAAVAPGGDLQEAAQIAYAADASRPLAAAFLADRIVLLHPPQSIADNLQQNDGYGATLEELRTSAAEPHPLFDMYLEADYSARFSATLAEMGVDVADTVARWSLGIDDQDDLTIRLTAQLADPADGERVKSAMTKIVPLLKNYLAMSKEMMPPFLETQQAEYPGVAEMNEQMVAAIDALDAALEKPQFTLEDDHVDMLLQAETDTPTTAAMLLITLMPREARTEATEAPQ